MPPDSSWSRLRETRLVQALVVYLAGAWVAVQAVSLISDAFHWPEWVTRGTIVLLAAGLVAMVVLVWAQSRAQARAAAAGGEAPPRSRPLLAGAVAIALLFVGAALFFVIKDRGRGLGVDEALAAAPGIAILPFDVNDPELERWREGLVDLLARNLDGAGGLRAIDSRTVRARWRERVEENESPDLITSLEIARSSGGRYAVVGSVVSSGTNMRVLADVYDLGDDRNLGQRQVEGAPDSIFGLVDQLSIAVLGLILERQAGDVPAVDLARITTTSIPALKAFLDAEAFARRSDFEAAIPAYERAVEADSTFALAGYRLAQAIGWMEGLDSPRSYAALERAGRFAVRLPERERESLETALSFFGRKPDATSRAQALTNKYPDDPGAWFLLGDVLFHLTQQSLASRADVEEPFERAIQLDPSYTPAYIHLLDLAFQWADSARLAELLPQYDQLAGGSSYDERYAITYDLTFGTPDQRQQAIAAMDTLDPRDMARIVRLLLHPRFLELQAQIGRRLQESGSGAEQLAAGLVWNSVSRGRIQEVLTALESDEIGPEIKLNAAGFLYQQGIELPPDFEERILDGGSAPGPGPGMFFAAGRAIADHRWAEFEATLAQLEQARQALFASGDSATAQGIGFGLQALKGRAAMERGEHDQARAILEPLYRETGFPPAAVWLAEIHAEAGRAEEAVRYLETFGPSPWNGPVLGALYEELGERDKAIEAYGWTTLAWERADPVLQPRVAEARQAIARLRGLQRG